MPNWSKSPFGLQTAQSGFLNQDFDHCWMPEKGLGAGTRAIGTRLENDNQIIRVRHGHEHLVSQNVERGAQGADDAGHLGLIGVHPRAHGNRIILADHLAEIAGRREAMVQAAVDDQEHTAALNLAVDDAADVDAGLADEIAPEFDGQPGLGER